MDEHFYRPESWFLKQGLRYDNYDRKGPKVFANMRVTMRNELTFILLSKLLSCVERNADGTMATYPLLLIQKVGNGGLIDLP